MKDLPSKLVNGLDSHPWVLALISVIVSITIYVIGIINEDLLVTSVCIGSGVAMFIAGILVTSSTQLSKKRKHAYNILNEIELIDHVLDKSRQIQSDIQKMRNAHTSSEDILRNLILHRDKPLNVLCKRVARLIRKCELKGKGKGVEVSLFIFADDIPVKAGSSNPKSILLRDYPINDNTDFSVIWNDVSKNNDSRSYFRCIDLSKMSFYKDSNHRIQNKQLPRDYIYTKSPFYKIRNRNKWLLTYKNLTTVPLLEYDSVNKPTVTGFLTISSPKVYDVSEANIQLAQLLAFRFSNIPIELKK